jgi:hypothetical protein
MLGGFAEGFGRVLGGVVEGFRRVCGTTRVQPDVREATRANTFFQNAHKEAFQKREKSTEGFWRALKGFKRGLKGV